MRPTPAILAILLAPLLAGCAEGPPAPEDLRNGGDGADLSGGLTATAAPEPSSEPPASGSASASASGGSPSPTASPPPNVPTGPTRPAATAPWTPKPCDPAQPTERAVNAWRLPGLQGSRADVAARLAALFNDTVSEATGADGFGLASGGSVRFSGPAIDASGYTDWIGVEGPAGLPAVAAFLDALWPGWRSAIALAHDAERVYDRVEGGGRVRQDPYTLRQALKATVPDGTGGSLVLSDGEAATGSILRHQEGATRIHFVSLDGLHEPAVLDPSLPAPDLEAQAVGYARCHLDATRPGGYTLAPTEWSDVPVVHWAGENGTAAAFLTVPYRLPGASGERLLEMRLDLGTGAVLSAGDGATRHGLG